MTSARKTRANRVNAQSSTGPKTKQGKAHAAQNARRHGLSLPIASDQILMAQVESIAREIAGQAASLEIYNLARQIAEAQIDLNRIRCARHDLLTHNIDGSRHGVAESLVAESTPHSLEKVSVALSKKLMRIDRYERRALSRRKFAIRALDCARQQVTPVVNGD